MAIARIDFIITWFLYFSATAFIGWIVESSYRSVVEHEIVNSGFLSGPFIPIYGFGSLAIAGAAYMLRGLPAYFYWLFLCLVPSLIEYAGSWVLERFFGLRLWDYHGQRLNIRGRVCLLYSLFWAGLTILVVLVVEPRIVGRIENLSDHLRYYVAGVMSAYFFLDTVASSRAMFNLKSFLAELKALAARGGSFLPSFGSSSLRLPPEIRRLVKPLRAFPALVRELRPSMKAIPDWIASRLEARVGRRHFRK